MVIESGIEGHVTFMTPAQVQRLMATAPGRQGLLGCILIKVNGWTQARYRKLAIQLQNF